METTPHDTFSPTDKDATGTGSAPIAQNTGSLDQFSSVLMIFVDGLPFNDRAAVVPAEWHSVPHLPTLGYSVNIEAELFAGASAEDLGWFCEWNPGKARKGWQAVACRLASFFESNEYLDYAAHRIIERMFREKLYNVPFRCLKTLHRNGVLPYDPRFPRQTLFQQFDIRMVGKGENIGRRDADVVSETIAQIADGQRKLFVPLVELDAISHGNSLDSEIRKHHLEQLRRNIERLWKAITTEDQSALCIVISDHGFADVTASYDLSVPDLLKRTGGVSGSIYTVESTLARIWCPNSLQVEAISNELASRSYGRVLNNSEREQHSIANSSFGDIIFVADEGVTFVPCTMTKRTVCAGMHGYLPDSPTQWGLISTSEPLFIGPMRSPEFYQVLADA
jgi:hypothetical protein